MTSPAPLPERGLLSAAVISAVGPSGTALCAPLTARAPGVRQSSPARLVANRPCRTPCPSTGS